MWGKIARTDWPRQERTGIVWNSGLNFLAGSGWNILVIPAGME